MFKFKFEFEFEFYFLYIMPAYSFFERLGGAFFFQTAYVFSSGGVLTVNSSGVLNKGECSTRLHSDWILQ